MVSDAFKNSQKHLKSRVLILVLMEYGLGLDQ